MPAPIMIAQPAAPAIRFRIASTPLMTETTLRHFFGGVSGVHSRYLLCSLRKISQRTAKKTAPRIPAMGNANTKSIA